VVIVTPKVMEVDQLLPCIYNVITMNSSIIKIGNSKGVRIPKALLEESGLEKDVEITAKKGEIVIAKAKKPSKSSLNFSEEYLLSLPALSDWNNPEEDEAWAHLQ
jgi:antitoxin component of MazEF toxin-antitoxin module